MIVRLIKLSVSLCVSLMDTVQWHARQLFGRERAATCVVLYYHAVPPGQKALFARQMDTLLRLVTPVGASRQEPLTAARRYAAVTFDDAFDSVVDNAVPELRSRRIPCTIFVPTGSMGTRPLWLQDGHPDAMETVATPETLRALAADALVEIGSHSITHPNFRMLDDGAARHELEASKAVLEAIVQRDVASFSFPHGSFTERSVELAWLAGYTRVFTIDPTMVGPSLAQFAVGRVRVTPDDWPLEFRLKATGAYRWLSPTSAGKRQLLSFLRSRLRLPQLLRRGA